ncbi:MAG: lytic transglycosylase domain-containing protein [Cyanobacteria bacterium]|nr:lytic transglycosylase domain-containing protein [Cyanobacteriota bacterium]
MDYIALNHREPEPRGVFYNYERKRGGVRYYQETKSRVEESPEKTIVKVDAQKVKQQTLKRELVETTTDPIEKTIEHRLSFKKTQERLTKEQKKIAKINRDYTVEIKGELVSFSELGIKKAKLDKEDQTWIENAHNYFITVKENNRAIGSSKDYTTVDVLEALWSTAVTVGADPKRYIVQVFNESRFDPHARGHAGERGIGQFKKTTAQQYGYDWDKMTDGINGFAYQAKAAAEFVKTVGEVAYNGKGPRAHNYQNKISMRLDNIGPAES